MNSKSTHALQNALGFPPAKVTGKYDKFTHTAVVAELAKRPLKGAGDWRSWPEDRQAVLFLQDCCVSAGFSPGQLDGRWGPMTAYAVEQFAHHMEHGAAPPPWRFESVPPNPNNWPLERQQDLNAFYGKAGESNLVTIDLPYALRLSWDTKTRITQTRCNEKVKDSLLRVLKKVRAQYGEAVITKLGLDLYGGGYNKRDKRGGSTLSTHAWGIAFDFDPDHNQLKWGRDRARLAGPEYDAWWRCWEDEGWVSLGRTRNYDWMHIQAARL